MTRSPIALVVVVFAVALVSSPVAAADPAPVKAKAPAAGAKGKTPKLKKGLGAPDYLPPLARQMLKRRMDRHGRDMSLVVQGVLLLQKDLVKELATNIANEPRIVRPLADGQDDLNAALPERFFVLQDELRDRARALAQAADKDDAELATALGQMMSTCVSCHSNYLAPKAATP